MKKLFFLAVVVCAFCTSQAQSSLSFPYQAVARDTTGTPIPNQAMKARISIRNGGASGTVVYQETDTFTTSSLGLFTIAIGRGTPVSGAFAGVNWADSTKYLQVEVDPAGGTSYLDMGTSQMLSVPFALYSLSSGSVTAPRKERFGITIDGSGDVITTGSKGFTQINYNGTITGWSLLADQAGSCVIDVKRSTYSSFPTTTTVTGGSKPALSSAQKNTSSAAGWSTSVTAGDTFEFVVDSATTVKRVTLVIETTIP